MFTLIEAKGLVKVFGTARALDDVNIDVGSGEIYGFFGPSGAGKSTCIRVLCGLTSFSDGKAQVMGIDVKKHPVQVRDNVAIMPESMMFYDEMTPRKFLNTCGRLMLMPKAARLEAVNKAADLADLRGFMDLKIPTLSQDQRQRIALARVLMSDAHLMFLDEPFAGVGVVHRRKLRGHLKSYVQDGNSVFFASGSLLEAEHTIDRFAFIDHGKIIATGTVDDLKEKYLAAAYMLQVSDPQMTMELLDKELKLQSMRLIEGDVSLVLQKRADAPRIPKILAEAGIDLFEMRTTGTLEEVFERIGRGEVA